MIIELSYDRMMGYLPLYWHDYLEMKRLLKAYSLELDELDAEQQNILVDCFILEMRKERIEEWERKLKLPPNGTLQQRRLAILNYFAVVSKMTKQSIQATVAALYKGARAIVTFEDSTIKVLIKPLPENYRDPIDVELLYKQLYERKPCHLSLWSERYMCTWGDVNNWVDSWQELSERCDNWRDTTLFIGE